MKKKKNLKNRILIGINYIVGITAVLAGCMLDSESMIPVYALFGCIAWFALFSYANRERLWS